MTYSEHELEFTFAKNVLSERVKESLLMAGSLILSGNYLNNLSHRFIHLSNFLKKLDSCSASGGTLSVWGCTYNFPL